MKKIPKKSKSLKKEPAFGMWKNHNDKQTANAFLDCLRASWKVK